MKPRPSHYNDAILKKFMKLAVFPRKVKLFHSQLGHSKDEERLSWVGSFAKAGWKQ